MDKSDFLDFVANTIVVGGVCGGIIGAYDFGKRSYDTVKAHRQNIDDIGAVYTISFNTVFGFVAGGAIGLLWPVSLPAYIAVKNM